MWHCLRDGNVILFYFYFMKFGFNWFVMALLVMLMRCQLLRDDNLLTSRVNNWVICSNFEDILWATIEQRNSSLLEILKDVEFIQWWFIICLSFVHQFLFSRLNGKMHFYTFCTIWNCHKIFISLQKHRNAETLK